MIKNAIGQSIGAQMINATTGASYIGTVTVFITGDAGTQAVGTVGSGICTAEGNGYFTYRPDQAETNYDLIAFTFVGSGAITQTVQVQTVSLATAAAVGAATTPGSITVRDLITAALRRINVLQAGAVPTPEDLADAFLRLQDLMDAWQTERLTIPFVQRTTWTITSTKGTLALPYTVGTGGDVNVLRPTIINWIRYQDTSVSPTAEYSLQMLTDDEWAAIQQKNLTSPLPVAAYYNPTYASNLGSLYLWQVPTSTTLQGVLYAPAGIAKFGSVDDVIILPPGYSRFIRENLAVELSGEWRDSLPPDPILIHAALESKANIKRINMRPLEILSYGIFDSRGVYDINSDRVI